MNASLRLLREGRSFNSLSLREVAREAGVVPTAFYRHFRTMDDLGLALVEEGSMTLRRMLREARSNGVPMTNVIRGSVLIYKRYVEDNRLQFLFIAGERNGRSPLVRTAIRREVAHFASEMAQDLRDLRAFPALSTPTLQMISGLVVEIMLDAAIDILDLAKQQPLLEAEMIDIFIKKLRLIFLGAGVWRDKTPS